LIEFFESVVGTFRITQPGSSVATSLVPGEAARKKIGILDIKGKNFRLHPVPLTQVRSFVISELSLREHRMNLDPEDPKVDAKVNQLLEEEVQLLLLGARDNAKDVLREARAAGSDAGDENSTIKYKLQRPHEVLVRIRVDHSGFSALNNHRFGAKFVGEVANPNDILLFHRKKDPKLASAVKKQGIKPIAPEELERTNMEDLVREHLTAPEGKLQLLGENDLSEALEEYVDKSMTAAIPDIAVDLLDKTQKTLIKGRKGEEPIAKESQMFDALDRETPSRDAVHVTRSQPGRSAERSSIVSNNPYAGDKIFDGEDNEHNDLLEASNAEPDSDTRKSGVSKTAMSRAQSSSSIEEALEPVQKASSRQRSAVTTDRPQRGATKRKVPYALEESDDEEFVSDEIVDSGDDDEEEEVTRPSKRKAPASKSRTKPKAAASRKPATSTRKSSAKVSARRMNQADSDDESLDDQCRGGSMDFDDDWGSAVAKPTRNHR
jgi:double-strand break repair protein MRE11